MPCAWYWLVVARIVVDILCHLHGFWIVLARAVRHVLLIVLPFAYHFLSKSLPCRQSVDRGAEVYKRAGFITYVYPSLHYLLRRPKMFFFQKELYNKIAWVWGCRLHEGCLMSLAWFWLALARIVQDALCHLHGFGQSWLELCRMPYAICMVLGMHVPITMHMPIAMQDMYSHAYTYSYTHMYSHA